jgi:CopG family transcriptional regulator/antitoxin EndoAI
MYIVWIQIINSTTMTRRINVVLPETTIRTIDRMAKPGERSRFIHRAVEHYISTQSTEAVQKRLEAALLRDEDIDRETMADWSAVDHDTWQQLNAAESQRKPATRSGAKSTSRRSTRR